MLPDVQEILLKSGIVDTERLKRAEADQKARGGNLVEALVRLSLCDERQAARHIAQGFSLPLAEAVQFDNLPVFVTRLVPPPLARAHRAIPLLLDRGVLHVALSDPTDRQALQDIASATGHIASPVVAPVSLLASALTRYYPPAAESGAENQPAAPAKERSVFSAPPPLTTAVARPGEPGASGGDLDGLFSARTQSDTVVTLERPKKSKPQSPGGIAEAVLRQMTVESQPEQVPPAAPENPPAIPSVVRPDPTLAAAPSPVPTRPDTVLDADQALAAIREASSRDEVAQVIVRYASHLLPRAVLLAVKNDMLVGWIGGGTDLGDIQVKGIMIPLTPPSVFKTVRETGTDYFGTMPATTVNDTYLAALGQVRPEQVVLIPINVRHRPVAILYGDCANRGSFSSDLSPLHLFAIEAGSAFERILLTKKISRTVIR